MPTRLCLTVQFIKVNDMKLIMRDVADKAWIRSYREPTDPEQQIDKHAKGAFIGIVAMFIGVVIMLCAIVIAMNKSNPLDAINDCVLSPDMQSYSETSKTPVKLGIEDTQ
jgi:hypothetical protein